jgi:outer membrane immunogenic protein
MALEHLINFRTTISALALAAALAPNVAFADGQSSYTSEAVNASQPEFSWTGFYAGVNAGGGFSSSDASSGNLFRTNSIHGVKGDGVVGGIQLGYNYQLSPLFVIGIEDDFDVTNISKRYSSSANTASLPWLGSGRARAGVTFLDGRLLAYGTAGLAFGKVNNAGIELHESGLEENMRLGWTAGAGLEWAIMPQLSVKGEYLYTDLDKTFKDDGVTGPGARFQEFRVGVNYHFNLF